MKTLFSSSRTARCLSAAAVALALGACGGGGGGGSTGGTPGTPGGGSSLKTGLFIDAAVSGLPYETTSGQKGKTGADGAFQYKEGDRVSFTLGNMALGSAKAAPKVFVWDLERAGEAANSPAHSGLLAALLLSMDKDGDPANGIQLHAEIDQAKGLPDLATVRNDDFVSSLETFVEAVEKWIADNSDYVGGKIAHWDKSSADKALQAGSDHLAQTAQEHYTPVPEPAEGLGGGLNCQGIFVWEFGIPAFVEGAALTPEAALEVIKGKALARLVRSNWDSTHAMCGAVNKLGTGRFEADGAMPASVEGGGEEGFSAQQVKQALSQDGVSATCLINKKDSGSSWQTAACTIRAKLYPANRDAYVWISDETITAGDDKGKTHRWGYAVYTALAVPEDD